MDIHEVTMICSELLRRASVDECSVLSHFELCMDGHVMQVRSASP